MAKSLTIILIIAVLGLTFFFFNKEDGDSVRQEVLENPDLTDVVTHSVVLKNEGYHPNEITIKRGEAVVFSTERGDLFWPASNIHPSHSIYSEFDPKIPVSADETWAFIFGRVGEWKYHDHLNPVYTGVVIVE